MAKKDKSVSKRIVKVDLSQVETKQVLPEGDYKVSIREVSQETGESSGKSYLKWVLEVESGTHKGATLYYNTTLQPQALFSLKNILLALGVSIPKSIMSLDLDSLEGLEMMVGVGQEIYDGKKKNEIIDTYPLAEDGESEEEDEEDEEEEEEEGEDDKSVDYSELSKDELKALCKERGIKLAKKTKLAEMVKLLEASDETEDSEDDEEEGPDYSALTLEELQDEIADRKLKAPKKPTIEKLIAILEEDDEE